MNSPLETRVRIPSHTVLININYRRQARRQTLPSNIERHIERRQARRQLSLHKYDFEKIPLGFSLPHNHPLPAVFVSKVFLLSPRNLNSIGVEVLRCSTRAAYRLLIYPSRGLCIVCLRGVTVFESQLLMEFGDILVAKGDLDEAVVYSWKAHAEIKTQLLSISCLSIV